MIISTQSPLVSTLLEILAAAAKFLNQLSNLTFVSTLLEILGGLSSAGGLRRRKDYVSTLLEILGNIFNRMPWRVYYGFQPFLRFWDGRDLAFALCLWAQKFQPFLRFWSTDKYGNPLRWILVSTLLEIRLLMYLVVVGF